MTKRRLLLKISGEVLKGESDSPFDPSICRQVATAVRSLVDTGNQVAMVVGGGNFCRGVQADQIGVERISTDYMGMLATMMNGLALKSFFKECGLKVAVLSALDCPKVVESYRYERIDQRLEENDVLLFVGGTGNPFFSTDTAAALRASEIHADFLLKATKVDGVYDKDPMKDPTAKRFDSLSFKQVIEKELKVMDQTAFTLCQESEIPIIVFNMDLLLSGEGSFEKIKASGTHIGE